LVHHASPQPHTAGLLSAGPAEAPCVRPLFLLEKYGRGLSPRRPRYPAAAVCAPLCTRDEPGGPGIPLGPVLNGSGRAPGFRSLPQWHSRARALGEEERGAGGGQGERRRSWELLTDLLFMECGSSLVDTVQMAAISW